MALPAVSTPSSTGSPGAIAPYPPYSPYHPSQSLAMKAMNSTPNMSAITFAVEQGAPPIVTRKEWVIPPRPKPGRKPATDTPPTKRKAQNRAAQRAFRERRAARVGELEEQLEETKEETRMREAGLRDKISRLEADVQRFNGELQSWRLRCDTLDRIVEYQSKEKEAAQAELVYLRNGAQTTGTDAVPLPPRRLRRSPKSQTQHQAVYTPQVEDVPMGCGHCAPGSSCSCAEEALAIVTSGCGNCGPNTSCQCLEETANSVVAEIKRSHSPSNEQVEKRQRQCETLTSLEVDFTTQFSASPRFVPRPTQEQINARRPNESCGFCTEGAYCMCAAEAAAMDEENRLAPLLNEVTPPPSDTDVEGTMKLPPTHPNQMYRPVNVLALARSCVNGPGTCQQCQDDPKSGLFCRSLAAMRAAGSAPADGCCGGNVGGGCCKTFSSVAPIAPPPSLTCADTYKTLATHKNFDQATDELNTWLGSLHATPPEQVAGRAPMEVEAASVMGVLKLFDRRFGRG
ncbi:hypothetical protein BJ878DRAFT_505033 [Calycina marina]|uniref:BZIP domain-containing protein n=1 Tax=Calycina marina TaxID=1763456 RepID=A0A9P7Z3H5_9HELO|nr:hypothetical protein BJ878DRAFT_505033 [Calycina marina]